jgi:hypothetical protein
MPISHRGPRHRAPLAPSRATARALAFALLGAALAACNDDAPAGGPVDAAIAGYGPGVTRQYGTPVKLGDGRARTYVILDQKNGGAPLEVGVALDERALDGLPAPNAHPGGGHADMHEFLLPMPAQNATPFQFVELDWNPGGHEPPGIYDVPHFDFHFYTIAVAERNAIDPSDPQYAAKGNRLPAADLIPAFNAIPVPPGTPPSATAVPRMGVHMIDMRSPEIQGMLGNPQGYKPFTTTFIHGAWDGRVIFWEPMITRAHILSKKAAASAAEQNQVIPLPLPQRYATPGAYPAAYRIAWDAQAKEYHIALTQLTQR